jgi:iron complex outermembrane receptor protein
LVVEGLGLHANAGRYARVPTLGERYGISAVVRGNPELASETGWTADLGAVGRVERTPFDGWLQLFGFARFADELIVFRRSSFGALRPYNAASARVLGLELAAGGSAFRIVRAGIALTLLDPRDTSAVGADLVPFESRLVARPELELGHAPRWPWLERAALRASYLYRASRVADPAGLIVLGAQHSLDLDATIALAGGGVTVRGRLANLLDQESFDVIGYPLPGRSAHLLAEVTP